MSTVQVALLPSLPAQAGISMILYPTNLLDALRGVSGISARLESIPFGQGERCGWVAEHWDRYVSYVRWCSGVQADLFHITDHSNAHLTRALPADRTVVTCHDLYPVAVALGRARFPGAESPLSMKPTALRLSALRKAAAVVAISRHTMLECHDYLGIHPSRLRLAYYGVSPLFSQSAANGEVENFRQRHGLRHGRVHVLHVGGNEPRKNLPGVFRVVAALRERAGREVCLVKVGPRFSPPLMDLLATLGSEIAVCELGALSPLETSLAYRSCDVLLYPSYHEGFCRPVAEAMACGTPVVASRCGAIPEVVQDARLLFDPEDAEAMALRILQIVESNDLRQEVVERGRQAASKFTWEAHGAAVAEAYKSITQRWV